MNKFYHANDMLIGSRDSKKLKGEVSDKIKKLANTLIIFNNRGDVIMTKLRWLRY